MVAQEMEKYLPTKPGSQFFQASAAAYDRLPCPTMPIGPISKEHRDLIPAHAYPFPACVARPVGRKQIESAPKAQVALDIEWVKLVDGKVWGQSKAREWADVAAEARRQGKRLTSVECLNFVPKRI